MRSLLTAWLQALVPLLLLFFLTGYALQWMLARPVGQVSIYGEARYLNQQALQAASLPWLKEAFWKVDLEGLRRELEKNPWLKRVEITRRWPDQIDIHLLEQTPWARWNQNALLNPEGEPFFPAAPKHPKLDLHFYSPPDRLQDLLAFYQELNPIMKEKIIPQITDIYLEPRGSWRLVFEDGVILLLGRDNIEKRINRFLWVWKHWSEDQRSTVQKIDVRYPNGLAVDRVSEKKSEE